MLAIRLLQLFSDDKSDYTMLTGTIGLYFQIRDDYINLKSQNVSSIGNRVFFMSYNFLLYRNWSENVYEW